MDFDLNDWKVDRKSEKLNKSLFGKTGTGEKKLQVVASKNKHEYSMLPTSKVLKIKGKKHKKHKKLKKNTNSSLKSEDEMEFREESDNDELDLSKLSKKRRKHMKEKNRKMRKKMGISGTAVEGDSSQNGIKEKKTKSKKQIDSSIMISDLHMQKGKVKKNLARNLTFGHGDDSMNMGTVEHSENKRKQKRKKENEAMNSDGKSNVLTMDDVFQESISKNKTKRNKYKLGKNSSKMEQSSKAKSKDRTSDVSPASTPNKNIRKRMNSFESSESPKKKKKKTDKSDANSNDFKDEISNKNFSKKEDGLVDTMKSKTSKSKKKKKSNKRNKYKYLDELRKMTKGEVFVSSNPFERGTDLEGQNDNLRKKMADAPGAVHCNKKHRLKRKKENKDKFGSSNEMQVQTANSTELNKCQNPESESKKKEKSTKMESKSSVMKNKKSTFNARKLSEILSMSHVTTEPSRQENSDREKTSNRKKLKAKKSKKLQMSGNEEIENKDGDVTKNMHQKKQKDISLKDRLTEQLSAARFRYLNEKLYTQTGKESLQLFRNDIDAFKVYHKGYQSQVERWPANPIDIIISQVRTGPTSLVIADFGCGDAKMARSLPCKVHSFDLVALNKHVTVCDISKVPLQNKSVDIAVFCLSLMGTNLIDYLKEANRVLRFGGVMKIAEVISRIENLSDFVKKVESLGFQLTMKDDSNTMFVMLDFKKVGKKKQKTDQEITLKPCLYKKR